MLIQRLNGNTLRRYHFAGHVVAVTREPGKSRRCVLIPKWCPHIAVNINAATVAAQLRQSRNAA